MNKMAILDEIIVFFSFRIILFVRFTIKREKQHLKCTYHTSLFIIKYSDEVNIVDETSQKK